MNKSRLKKAIKRSVKADKMLIIPLGSLRRANQYKLLARNFGILVQTDATTMGYYRKRDSYHAVFYIGDNGKHCAIHTHPSVGLTAPITHTINL